jgi:nudix-type nucleoside diphosphatase (YffH/AdpP family)
MAERVKIEKVETLSSGWARNLRYTINYQRFDGRRERLVREVHDHGSGAGVLPYDASRGTVLLVRQFRLPVHLAGHGGDTLEICAGLLDGNDPETCARREAEEELGFRLTGLRRVAHVFTTPGAVTEELTLFLADYSLAQRVSAGGGHVHESEDIEVVEVPFAAALDLALARQIRDAKTVMLLLFLDREINPPTPHR